MANKKVKIGSLIANKKEFDNNGTKVTKTLLSLALGVKNPNDASRNLSVEITIRDSKGNIVVQQRDGFLDLIDPRKQPDELLAANKISKEMASKMKEGAAKLSEKVKYQVLIRS